MSDRIGEDALVDVGCFLDRFGVDSIQCLSWKSHTYLANKSHILPVRLLYKAQISFHGTYVIPQGRARGSVRFNGTPQERFQLALAAIKDSDLNYITLFDPTYDPITDEELAQIAAVAPTVKVADLRLLGHLRHLSPAALHRLMFGFASFEELTLYKFNGNQLTDEHLHECGRRQIWRLRVTTESADAGPLAFGDEALLNFLFFPDQAMPKRKVVLTAFNASPQFVQKLISRARLATNVDRVNLEVKKLPLGSQQLGGLRLINRHSFSEHFQQLENGARLTLQFGRDPVELHPFRTMDDEEESQDEFRFILSK
ncbi:hypothetical protein AAVH_39721 [Aphelenchoides avenae]|nr:hypothetical protein AAVH_39721 [Aphelenchus avenae]